MADYAYDDIVNALGTVGIASGDDVFLHSNLGFFGRLSGCTLAEELSSSFWRALREVTGDDGTVIVPTFSYSFCHDEVYDPYETGTTCGMLADFARRQFPQNRTWDPNFSVCGEGVHMDDYLRCNIHESFGSDCFWEKFLSYEGKIVCMNFDAGSTFVHYIERKNDVPYRFNKAFNGTCKRNGKLYRDYAVHFCFDGTEDAPCMERVDKLCRERGLIRQTTLGKGSVLAFAVRAYFDYFTELLKTRPRVFCAVENPV